MSDQHFRHDYLLSNEFRADATTLCVKCAATIRSEKPREMERNGAKRWVTELVRHNNYRLVPITFLRDEKMRMIHVPVCSDCMDFTLTPEIAHLIKLQIMRAEMSSAQWCGYPEELKKAIRARWSRSEILERLSGTTLEEAYNFKLPEEARL